MMGIMKNFLCLGLMRLVGGFYGTLGGMCDGWERFFSGWHQPSTSFALLIQWLPHVFLLIRWLAPVK
jgi:hypothetical protein